MSDQNDPLHRPRGEIARRLTYDACIPIVRDAMIAFSKGETVADPARDHSSRRRPGLRRHARGRWARGAPFGAKILSVFPENFAKGVQSHQGVVLLFDPDSGAPVCILHAGEITAIRTAAASAVATRLPGPPGRHAPGHHRLRRTGRDPRAGHRQGARPHGDHRLGPISRAGRGLCRAHDGRARDSGLPRAPRPRPASPMPRHRVHRHRRRASRSCSAPGSNPETHLNLVGSSIPGPVEVDDDLVVRSRFFVDSREGVLRQGAEFLHAREAGLVGDDHILGEIGQVLAGETS